MKRVAIFFGVFLFFILFLDSSIFSARIKDIANFLGARYNKLFGYGLVVGLNGTGDKDQTDFTVKSLTNMLNKLGIRENPDDVKVKNVAAVMVTAELPPFAKPGDRIDVLVSAIGDATNIQGGTLIMTPLLGPDGNVYAVAQGPVSIGGFSVRGAAGGVQKNHPTAGIIPNGAIIEKEVPTNFSSRRELIISLNYPDFTTSQRVAQIINRFLGKNLAKPIDGANIKVEIPKAFSGRVVKFVSVIENLEVEPDRKAKVVILERTGTVVIGDRVRISTVAVAHGNLSVIIREMPKVVQPMPFGRGKTTVVPRTEAAVKEEKARLLLLKRGVTIGDVVRALNSMGVSPRDLIAILQAIKRAGALEADLEIM